MKSGVSTGIVDVVVLLVDVLVELVLLLEEDVDDDVVVVLRGTVVVVVDDVVLLLGTVVVVEEVVVPPPGTVVDVDVLLVDDVEETEVDEVVGVDEVVVVVAPVGSAGAPHPDAASPRESATTVRGMSAPSAVEPRPAGRPPIITGSSVQLETNHRKN